MIFEDLETKDCGLVIEMLVLNGVSPVDANNYVCSVSRSQKPVTFHEIYGRGGLCDAASKIAGIIAPRDPM